MKVLFLDIDGVVNSANYVKRRFEEAGKAQPVGIDPDLADIVRNIQADTGCAIVLSSSWRIWEKSRAEVQRDVGGFIDVTPDHKGKTDRGCEVIAWLEQHPEVTKHAILDDNSDFHKDQPLFKTSWETGITQEIADQVVEYLNG